MPITINGTTGVSGVDGSAGTPALQGGDTNTGIVFGTDTVGVSTGGVQRTTVDSSGRLLVGVGSANANGGILQLTSGITFPATAVAASDAKRWMIMRRGRGRRALEELQHIIINRVTIQKLDALFTLGAH
jgi:hypothetical protein